MKSTEFVTPLERRGDANCGTNCPRCGANVVVPTYVVVKKHAARCNGCDNTGVATMTSVIWKYAYEGRESLSGEVARTKPRNPSRERAGVKTEFDERAKKVTAEWITLEGMKKEIGLEGPKEVSREIDEAARRAIKKRFMVKKTIMDHVGNPLVTSAALPPGWEKEWGESKKQDEPLSFDTSDDLAELFRRRDEQKKDK